MKDKLNIGGGRGFNHTDWINLDSTQNPPFVLSPSAVFPVVTGSISLVYSSHCLEHLDDETVTQVLEESRRALSNQGVLFLKIPDFEMVLQRWRDGDAAFFTRLGIDPIVYTWPRRGMMDTINARAAMLFCGFWNAPYGDHFGGQINYSNIAAYHGPPVVPDYVFEGCLQLESPHEISRWMATFVREKETSYTFNHQNAWGRHELMALLAESGLEVLSFDKEEIIRDYAGKVPDIHEHGEYSLYCVAVPCS